jgi:hypothetical protein
MQPFDPTLAIGLLTPYPGVGCLNALIDPMTEVMHEALAEGMETSAKSASGMEFPVDVIICASSFDASFKPKYLVVGLKRQNLSGNPELFLLP